MSRVAHFVTSQSNARHNDDLTERATQLIVCQGAFIDNKNDTFKCCFDCGYTWNFVEGDANAADVFNVVNQGCHSPPAPAPTPIGRGPGPISIIRPVINTNLLLADII